MATLPPVELDGKTIAGPADVRAAIVGELHKYRENRHPADGWRYRFEQAHPTHIAGSIRR